MQAVVNFGELARAGTNAWREHDVVGTMGGTLCAPHFLALKKQMSSVGDESIGNAVDHVGTEYVALAKRALPFEIIFFGVVLLLGAGMLVCMVHIWQTRKEKGKR